MDFKRVLVSVNGSKVDDETIRLACSVVRKAKGKIYAIYVIEVKRTFPLDTEIEPEIRKGEQALDRAERIAEGENCEIETELLQAREVGPAVVDEAVERGVELIITGMSYIRRFGEFSIGETIPYLLKNAPCWVIVYREPIT